MPDICAPSLQEESLPVESTLATETQERARLPGLLTEANRITGGTSSNQRKLLTTNSRDYQMVKGKCKNVINRNQDHSLSSEPSTPTSASLGYTSTPEKQYSDLKSYLMMLEEDFKKGINNSLKEIQENTAKELQVLIEKQKNTPKQVMEMDKTILDLKREVDTIKKTQSEATLEIENVGKKSGTIDVSISNRIQEMEERISGANNSIENIGTTIKENTK